MIRLMILIALMIAAVGAAHAADPVRQVQNATVAEIAATTGTASVEYTRYTRNYLSSAPQSLVEWKITWTANASGTMYFATDQIQGTLLEIRTDPDDNAPTTLYDVTILRDAIDVMNGGGLNRSATDAQIVGSFLDDQATPKDFFPSLIGENTYKVENAGDGNEGIIYLIVLE